MLLSLIASWSVLRITSPRWFVALAMGFTAQACASGYNASAEVEKGVSECVGPDSNALKCARGIERKQIRSYHGTVNRSAGVLRIRIAKKTVTLMDKRNMSGDDSIAYSFFGFDKKLNSHVLHVQLHEGGHFMLIHHDSGQIAYPSGYPIASSDGKNFLSISEDLTARYNSNNIEIWQLAMGEFRKVAEFEPEWGPSDGRWIHSRGIRIDKNCVDLSGGRSTLTIPCGFAIVTPSESGWKLIE